MNVHICGVRRTMGRKRDREGRKVTDCNGPERLDSGLASLQATEPYATFKNDSRYALRAQVPAGLNRKEAEIYSRLDPEPAPPHRHHHGRKWPVGQTPPPAARCRTSLGRGRRPLYR